MSEKNLKAVVPYEFVRQLNDLFREIDVDGSKRLDPKELRVFIKRLGWSDWGEEQVKEWSNDTVEIREKGMDFIDVLDKAADKYLVCMKSDNITEVFQMIDGDGSGEVDENELIVVFQALEVEEGEVREIMEVIMDGKRVLDQEMFVKAILKAEEMKLLSVEVLLAVRKAFKILDDDGGGFIELEEFGSLLFKLGVGSDEAKRERWFGILDQRGDGKVYFNDFLECLAEKRFVDTELEEFFTAKQLSSINAYLLQSSEEELRKLCDINQMPIMERLPAMVIRGICKRRYERNKKKAKEMKDKGIVVKKTSIFDQENAKIPDSFKKTFNRRSWYFAFRCFLLGLFSGIVGAIFEVVAMELYPPDDSLTSKTTIMHYFIMFFPMGVAGIIEVLVMYYDGLCIAVTMSLDMGVGLFPIDAERAFIMNAIIKEALELGHPTDIKYNINPLAEVSALQVLVCSAVYAARKGATGFIVKILVKRVLVRSALKGGAAFFAVPVVASWNLLLGRKVMANIRTLLQGIVLLPFILDSTLGTMQNYSLLLREALVRALAVTIVKRQDRHANLEVMLKHLIHVLNVDVSRIPDIDNVDLWIDQVVPKLKIKEQDLLMRVFSLALIADGDIEISEKLLLQRALRSAGMYPKLDGFKKCQEKFSDLTLEASDIIGLYPNSHVFPEDGMPPALTAKDKVMYYLNLFLSYISM